MKSEGEAMKVNMEKKKMEFKEEMVRTAAGVEGALSFFL